MAYIFLDESGDLGFNFKKKKTSRYFVVTLLYTERKEPLEKIVKKIFRGFRQTGKSHATNVIHAYKESRITNERILKHLNELDVEIHSVSIHKKNIPKSIRSDIHVLYRLIVSSLLCVLLDARQSITDEPIYIVVSQRETNKSLNKEFIESVQKFLERYDKNISVTLASPAKEKGLQIVDAVSWSIYQKYEYGNTDYCDLISQRLNESDQKYVLLSIQEKQNPARLL
jgi:tetrahydromethanopterin S-methyltransferase subunit G